jgi:SpoVK/Ycf46/Vps4 family AAA+-type ATPase
MEGLLTSKDEAGEEHTTVINSFLQQIGGFIDSHSNIILIGATNFPFKIEKAVLRAGRFSDHFYIRLPNEKERLEMLQKELKDIEVDKKVDLNWVASFTKGASGAEIHEMIEKIKIELAYSSILNNSSPLLTKALLLSGRKYLKRATTEEMLSSYESFDKQGRIGSAVIDQTVADVSYGLKKFIKRLFKSKKNKK